MYRRLTLLALGLGLLGMAGPGCRSLSEGGLRRLETAKTDPLSPTKLSVQDHIQRHNEAVELVQSVKVSDLDVQVQSYQTANGRERQSFFANTGGVLLVERPKNLRLMLRRAVGGEVADIGSNPNEFWVSNAMDKQMVLGRYEQARLDPMTAAISPDWIMEVMGLQPIPNDVAFAKGKTPGTYVLTERRPMGPKDVWFKETTISEKDGRILEHQLLAKDKTLIARATVRGFQEISLPGDELGQKVSIPQTMVLKIPDVAELSLSLRDVKINPADGFTQEAFLRPNKENEGYALRDIREIVSMTEGNQVASAEIGSSDIPPPIPDRLPQNLDNTIQVSAPAPVNRSGGTVSSRVNLRSTLESGPPDSPSANNRALWETPIPRPSPPPVQRSSWRSNPGLPRPIGIE